MFDRLLVAIDGSQAGHEAVSTAAAVAKRFGSDVTVLHVLEHKLTWAADIDLESEQEALACIAAALRDFEAVGVSAHGEVTHAPTAQTAEEIVRAAEQGDASLIVLGTRGFSDAKALLLGSVAHDVLHRARCPVLVTPQAGARARVEASSRSLDAVG
jgi:nucleotide-binding universal stress UspA family protein